MRRTLLVPGALVAGAALAVGLSCTPSLPWRADLANDSITLQRVSTLLEGGDAAASEAAGDRLEQLTDFYSAAPAEPLWIEGGRLASSAEHLRDVLDALEAEGLDPDLFRTAAVTEALDGPHRSDDAAALAEIALAGLFLRLADAFGRGHQDPAQAELQWDLTRDSVPYAQLLASVADGEDPGTLLREMLPTLPWYAELREALGAYREAARDGEWPQVPEGDALQRGDTSARVAAVRARLTAGLDAQARSLAAASGQANVFDADLAAAVARFQTRHGIAVDSVVGDATLLAMNVPIQERIADLELNLDRLRSLPDSMGPRFILVNVAGFDLMVMEGTQAVMRMGVVVGRPEWRTAIFQDEMEYLVVNPYWHVPKSIAIDEILPAIRADPGYLEAENLVLVTAGDNLGAPVSAETVDWSAVDPESFPYDFRQDPGPTNALGRVKFMFPNEHNIYLHDTPAGHLFERHFRAFSHGCIRVERPEDLAHYVLEHASDVSPEEFDRLMAGQERAVLDLREPMPVYITYFTAWPNQDGTVHFYHDLYELDEALRIASRAGG
jgi:L,D-transpeptidase YcbB